MTTKLTISYIYKILEQLQLKSEEPPSPWKDGYNTALIHVRDTIETAETLEGD